MQNQPVSFYSEGVKLRGDLFVPDGLAASERRPGEPKRLVVLRGFGPYEVYTGDAFRQVMERTLGWYRQYLAVGQQGGTKP